MDKRQALYAIKARMLMEASLGVGFVGQVDLADLQPVHARNVAKRTLPPGLPKPNLERKLSPEPAPALESKPATGPRFVPLVPKVDAAPNPEKEAALEPMRGEARSCAACGLCERRSTVVWGEGGLDARVVFVGDAPGRDEDEQGRPFVGRSGRLFTDIVEKGMKLPRGEVYLTHAVKCRPPGNRAPRPLEVEACSRYLSRQIEVIGPKALVAVGEAAGRLLLGLPPGTPDLMGKWHERGGVPLRVIHHPAELLRRRGPENRKSEADLETWRDIQAVLERVAPA